MVSIQNLEFELQDLLKKKKYSEIIFEITTKTKEEERNAGLFVLLGISRISSNKKNKSQIELALSDFKKGYLKEKTSENGLNALVNFVLASAILSDFENTNIDFNEIRDFYQKTPKNFQNKRAINIAMTIGLAPVIGIPLPFISYGGSSLWAFTILLFIFINLDSYRLQVLR